MSGPHSGIHLAGPDLQIFLRSWPCFSLPESRMDILDRLGTSALFARVDFFSSSPGQSMGLTLRNLPLGAANCVLIDRFARAGSWALYETREWIKGPGRKEVKGESTEAEMIDRPCCMSYRSGLWSLVSGQVWVWVSEEREKKASTEYIARMSHGQETSLLVEP
jgi:hypothetical protein